MLQPVAFEGAWQTTPGATQFHTEIPLPNGTTVTFEADFPPPMGGTGSAPNPLAYCFWGGLAFYRRGEQEQAEQRWRQALRAPLPDEGTVDFLEFVMAHYYLGDKEGRGLASVLDDLRQQQDVAFGQLFLAGLGWALRNDRTAAHSNFRLAVMRSKSTASGRLLPHFWWAFCADLLPASEHDDYARYFADATSTRAEKTIQEK